MNSEFGTPGFPDLITSTYDSYPSTAAFTSAEAIGFYGHAPLGLEGPKDFGQAAPGSPSTSMSHSTDQASSNFSHASATSGQSAASSAVGSPFSHNTHTGANEHWIAGSRLGNNPRDYHDFSYHLSTAGGEQIQYDDKFPGSFVGELTQLPTFSPVIPSSASCSPISSTASSLSPVLCPSLALDTSMRTRRGIIDSIMEEGTTSPSATVTSPPSATSSFHHSPNTSYSWPARKQRASSFRSPVTPASAIASRSRANSPYERRKSSLSHENHTKSSSPPLLKQEFPSQISSNQAFGNHFQNTFFNQSSGSFIAPLESSCWCYLPRAFSFSSPFILLHISYSSSKIFQLHALTVPL